MNKTMYDMIFKRKSFHLFRNVGNESIADDELKEIKNAFESFTPLFPQIKTAMRIVKSKEVGCKRGGEYCILLYSETKDGYLQNIGYLGEQLDLYLVSKNIGTLWFGIGKPDEKAFDGLNYVIMIVIKKIADESKFRKDMFKSKRKQVEEIWSGDTIEGVTDIVRFAPSACNSQPWFVKNGENLSVFRYKKAGKRGIMPSNMVSFYNRIDIGIFMCFLDICLENKGIEFKRELFCDNGADDKMNLNAVYKF